MNVPKELLIYLRSGKPLYGDLSNLELYLALWQENEIEQLNKSYEIDAYAPGFYGIGSDGGGEMIAIGPEGRIYALPFIGMAPTEARLLASSWNEFETMIIQEPNNQS